MEARRKRVGSEFEVFRALPPCLAPGAEPALPCLQVGWIKRYFPLQKRKGGAFHSHGASHRQPSAHRKIVDLVAAALILPLLKERISHSLFHQKVKAQADWKDWLRVMLVEDLILYLCTSKLCAGSIYACSFAAVH